MLHTFIFLCIFSTLFVERCYGTDSLEDSFQSVLQKFELADGRYVQYTKEIIEATKVQGRMDE